MTRPDPTTFPGCIYDPQGKRLDAPGPDMTQEQLDEHLHQTLFVMQESAPVSRVWLLADDADAAGVPAVVLADAVRLVVTGQGILIAARQPEAEVDVREGLVRALELFEATAGTDEQINAWPDSGGKA